MPSRSSWIRRVSAGLVAVLLIAGCGSDSSSSRSHRKVRVALASPNAEFAIVPYGADTGLFEKAGIDVEWRLIQPGPNAIAAMVSGDIDVGVIAAPTPQNAIVQGAKLDVVAVSMRRVIYQFIGRPGIDSIADLAGKRVGVSGAGSPSDFFTSKVLRAAGLEPGKDVEMLSLGGGSERLAAFVAGQIDAVLLSTSTAPAALEKTNGKVLIDLSQSDEVFPFASVSVTSAFADANEDLLVDFLRTYAEATTRFKNDPVGGQATIAKLLDQPVSDKTKATYEEIIKQFDDRPVPHLDEAEAVLALLQETVPQAKDFSATRLFNATYIEKALQAGK